MDKNIQKCLNQIAEHDSSIQRLHTALMKSNFISSVWMKVLRTKIKRKEQSIKTLYYTIIESSGQMPLMNVSVRSIHGAMLALRAQK